MYRKYKVTSGDRNKQQHPTAAAAEVNALITARLVTSSTFVAKQQKTSSSLFTSSTPVAKQHDVASSSSSSNEDAVVIATVDAAWKMIDEQSEQEMQRRRREESATAAAATGGGGGGGVGRGGRGWKTIRVFVSSTFTDMHSEREILVKKVFPELREWCEERKFSLVDCDLRWGVPKDSPSRTTICTCLEEIDRCYEDNERLPFFVSILSDRYGWIPGESEVPDDVREKYDWVPQTSITHMEILHGAYRFSNPNAIFCLRNSSYVEHLPADKVGRFVDDEKLNQLQLKVLKQRLITKFLNNQVFEYNCRVDGVDMSTGREKVNIVGLESFAEKILDFLKSAINRQYPDQHLTSELTASQMEQNAHDASMQVKSELFVGRETELRAMFDYIRDGTIDLQTLRMSNEERRRERTMTEEDNVDEKQTEEEDEKMRKKAESLRDDCLSFGVDVEDSRILSIVGQSGIGKSSLLAKLAKTANEEGLDVLYHSVGTTDVSTTSKGIIRRIIDSLKEKNNKQNQQLQQQQQQQQHEKKSEEEEDQTEAEEGGGAGGEAEENENENKEENYEDLIQQLKDALAANAAAATEADDQLLLIIIDGLDELIDSDANQFLRWLPPRFPRRLRCVVSCAVDHYPGIARLESRDSLFVDVNPLTPEESASMVEYYLQRFNKRLDSVQLSTLLSHPSSSIPLWLSIACEELRVFGDFATVSSKIQNFPDELNELMKDVIKRLIREDETQAMRKVLSWIQCSKSGLPEKAILSLLGNPATKEPAPLVTWATVRRHLKPFIRSTGDSQSVRIRMAHTAMNRGVEELLFCVEEGMEDVEERKNANFAVECHSYLADFYQYHCSFVWMTLSELPHHLLHAKLGQRMIDFFRKDERSASVSAFERSRLLNKLRCKWFVTSHFGGSDDSSIQFYACHMCSIRGRLLHPTKLMPTKDMCAICGNWATWKKPTNVAKVCLKHRNMHGPSTMAKCLACGKAIFLSNPMNAVLHLCHYCHMSASSSTMTMRCCHLEK